VASLSDWIKLAGSGATPNHARRTKLWIDNAASSWHPPTFGGGEVTVASYNYDVLNVDADGKPILVAIDSPEFYSTYSQGLPFNSIVNVYREYAFAFPNGVPSLKRITLSAEEASTWNPIGDPAQPVIGYPVRMRSNMMLVPMDGTVACIDYQEFLALYRSVIPVTAHQKLVNVRAILDGADTDEHKVAACLVALKNTPGVPVSI
jgi:hypothetical protein